MKFPKISALVPQGEHFDESAVNEGVWMSESHLSSIESALVTAETATAETATQLETANASIVTLTEEVSAEKINLSTAQTTISTQAARIAALEAEVVALGQKPSGKGTNLPKEKDDSAEEVEKPSYASDSNPANAWIDKQLALKQKAKV
jgi:hypothetical protein